MIGPTLSQNIANLFDFNTVLRRLILLVPKLDLKARKVILNICQTRIDCAERPELLRDMRVINKSLSKYDDYYSYSDYDLQELSSTIAQSPTIRSFISMLVRNEVCDERSGAEEAIQEGFLKEFGASQKEQERKAQLNFQCLDKANERPMAYSIYYPMTPWWTKHAKQFIERLVWKLDRIDIIYPKVQRRKNMSRDTCRNMVLSGATHRPERDFRTVDLEVWSLKTGQRIQGDCEMRKAWKFNELKPRLYYCMGGTSYWRSRYMKRIAIAFMECVDATKLTQRQDPTLIQYYLDPDEWLTLWDMTSFTTSLDQLKHFIYYVAKAMEDDLRVQQNPLRLFDYQQGIVEVTADKLLLEFNEENQYAPFSIWRVADQVFDSMDTEERFYQQSSGMLGVNGNIGTSCCFHGFHLEAGVKPKCGCSVGDDALGGTDEDPRERLIPHMRLIGDIMEEKAEIFEPLGDEYEQAAKFLKRRFTRDRNGISLDFLCAFPSLAQVFGLEDGYHTVRELSREDLIVKFSSQVGAFFWQLFSHGYMDDQDYDLINRVLSRAYRRLNLSSKGHLPGSRHQEFQFGIPVAVPPLYFRYNCEDWAEYLWDNSNEKFALLPVTNGPSALPAFVPGLEFEATESVPMNILEDIGCLEKMRAQKEWFEVTNTNRRVFRSFLSGTTATFWCRYTEYSPEWIDTFTDPTGSTSFYDVRSEFV